MNLLALLAFAQVDPANAAALVDDIIPVVDQLGEPILLLGIPGGVIVTTVISILKHFGVVNKEGPISPDLANYILSLALIVIAGMVGGYSIGQAVTAGISAVFTATGVYNHVTGKIAKATAKNSSTGS